MTAGHQASKKLLSASRVMLNDTGSEPLPEAAQELLTDGIVLKDAATTAKARRESYLAALPQAELTEEDSNESKRNQVNTTMPGVVPDTRRREEASLSERSRKGRLVPSQGDPVPCWCSFIGRGCPGKPKAGNIYRQDVVKVPGMKQRFFVRSVDPNKLGFPFKYIWGSGGA